MTWSWLRTTLVVTTSILLLTAFAVLTILSRPVPSLSRDLTSPITPWGVQELRPTRFGGHVWYADWDDRTRDPWIRWIETGATHRVRPDAEILEVGGQTVRMYVLDPRRRSQWTGDLEVTVYARRLPGANAGDPWSGIVTDVRTNHGSVHSLERNPCDSRGLLARLRFDGYADFGKEVRHPNTVARHEQQIWPDGMPVGKWIGYKHLVYDTDDGVVQELWVDFPGHGQHWERVDRSVDHGQDWGRGEASCAPGIDPAMELRGDAEREGSESGLPNVAVLFRVDELSPEGGMEYRWASVREVE